MAKKELAFLDKAKSIFYIILAIIAVGGTVFGIERHFAKTDEVNVVVSILEGTDQLLSERLDISIINDHAGMYLVQKAQFHKSCYDAAYEYINLPPDNPATSTPRSFKRQSPLPSYRDQPTPSTWSSGLDSTSALGAQPSRSSLPPELVRPAAPSCTVAQQIDPIINIPSEDQKECTICKDEFGDERRTNIVSTQQKINCTI